MNDAQASFQITLSLPVELSESVERNLTVASRPRWHVSALELKRLNRGEFSLTLYLPASELQIVGDDLRPLRAFRDCIVSLVAFTAMAPVEALSKGTFDLPVQGRHRRQVSLGPGRVDLPTAPLVKLEPLVTGLTLEPKYHIVLHFLWQALSAGQALYRFVNLAIGIELLVKHDSPAPTSRAPRCSNPKCGTPLAPCHACGNEWTIPSTLRERCAFLFENDATLSQFIRWRNQVFHGHQGNPLEEAEESLPALNTALLLMLRNHIAAKLGLTALSREQLALAVNPLVTSMTVDYELPPLAESKTPRGSGGTDASA